MCDFNIPRLSFGDQRLTFVDKQKLGLKNPPFHLPKNFIDFNCSGNIVYSGDYSLVSESHVPRCFLTVEFRTNLALTPCKMNFKPSVKFWKFLEISKM